MQSSFNFGVFDLRNQKLNDRRHSDFRNVSPTDSEFAQLGSDTENKMLHLTITQAAQSHYPVAQQTLNLSTRNTKNRASFATDLPITDPEITHSSEFAELASSQ